MKYLVVLVLVLGIAHANAEQEVSLDEILTGKNLVSVFSTLMNDDGARTTTEINNIKMTLDALISPIAAIAMGLIEFANGILALVGLVFLIIYLIAGGDFKALLGTARSSQAWIFNYHAIMDNPVFETVNEMVQEAIGRSW